MAKLNSSASVLSLERRKLERRKFDKDKAEKIPRATPIPSGPLSVVDRVRLALRRRSRLTFTVGMLLGGFVPLATFITAHTQLDWSEPLYEQTSSAFVAGGLLFSAVTMFSWGRLAFRGTAKALGFVLLLEGTMITCHTRWLAIAALCYLCMINGVETACNLARPEVRPEPT